jgi:hypothetical protein
LKARFEQFQDRDATVAELSQADDEVVYSTERRLRLGCIFGIILSVRG